MTKKKKIYLILKETSLIIFQILIFYFFLLENIHFFVTEKKWRNIHKEFLEKEFIVKDYFPFFLKIKAKNMEKAIFLLSKHNYKIQRINEETNEIIIKFQKTKPPEEIKEGEEIEKVEATYKIQKIEEKQIENKENFTKKEMRGSYAMLPYET